MFNVSNNIYRLYNISVKDTLIDNIQEYKNIEICSTLDDTHNKYLVFKMIESFQKHNDSIIIYCDLLNSINTNILDKYISIDKERIVIIKSNDPISLKEYIDTICTINIPNRLIIIDPICFLDYQKDIFSNISKFIIDINKIVGTNTSILYMNQYRYNKTKDKYQRFCSKIFELYCNLRLELNDYDADSNTINIDISKNKIYNDKTSFRIGIK